MGSRGAQARTPSTLLRTATREPDYLKTEIAARVRVAPIHQTFVHTRRLAE